MYCISFTFICYVFFACCMHFVSLSPFYYLQRFASLIDKLDSTHSPPFLHYSRFNFSRECIRIISSFTYFVPRCSLPDHCGKPYVEKGVDVSFFTSLYVCYGFYIPLSTDDSHFEVLPQTFIPSESKIPNCLINPFRMYDWNFIFMKHRNKYAMIPRMCESYYDISPQYVDRILYTYKRVIRPFRLNFSDSSHLTIYYHELIYPQFCKFEMLDLEEFIESFSFRFQRMIKGICTRGNLSSKIAPLLSYADGPASYRPFDVYYDDDPPIRLCLHFLNASLDHYFPALCRNHFAQQVDHVAHIRFQTRYITFFEGLIDYFFYFIIKIIKFLMSKIFVPLFDYIILNFKFLLPLSINFLNQFLTYIITTKYFIYFIIFLYLYYITKNFIFSLSFIIFIPILLLEFVDLN